MVRLGSSSNGLLLFEGFLGMVLHLTPCFHVACLMHVFLNCRYALMVCQECLVKKTHSTHSTHLSCEVISRYRGKQRGTQLKKNKAFATLRVGGRVHLRGYNNKNGVLHRLVTTLALVDMHILNSDGPQVDKSLPASICQFFLV